MLKKIVRCLLALVFRVSVKGFDNYQQAGARVLIIANHLSFLDPLLLWAFLPDDITFAINTHISQRRWLRPFLRFATVFPMDPTHPLSLKNLVHHLQKDNKTVIFPEGRITATGSLMKIYDGTGMVADKSDAMILPIRVHGTEFSHFSKMQGIFRLRFFPKVTLHILPPTPIEKHKELSGKNRRKVSGHILADIMTEMMFETSHYRQSIFSALLEARRIHGGKHTVAEDLERIPLSYNTLITRSIALGNALAPLTVLHEKVGVFLPNSTKTLYVVLGLQLQGRVPAMLNYSTGCAGMLAGCRLAKVKTVLTSRKFIELGKFTEEALQLSQYVQLVYLEDLAEKLSRTDKIKALLKCYTADLWHKDTALSADSPAVVLFTSGSEGTPKGVVLSHANILANHKQVAARISFTPQDVVLNFLPMFHSFGFTVGTLLPILNGMSTFFYPSPLHYAVIPEVAYEINATILFGTNTFLAAYAKKAHAYDFYTLRYVVAGAEKLQESTRLLWADKFGIRILEGYGATETAPVAAVNTPMDFKAGTVGRLLPGMQCQLEPVPGIDVGGKLHVAGPNIMLGYLFADQPGELIATESVFGKGWYDTGDIVHIDEDGFVSIRGRSKRFAKIGGEMVSLTAVESYATQAWPSACHAAVSLPDAKKGEQIILVTTQKEATLSQLSSACPGVASVALPKKILVVDHIPVMASGKTNYPGVSELVDRMGLM